MAAPSPRRRVAALLLVAVVTLLHLQLGGELLGSQLGSGAADRAPRRIEVAFVRELQPTAPVVVAAPKPRLRRARAVVPASPAASAPATPAEAPAPERAASAPAMAEAPASGSPEPSPVPESTPVAEAASSPEVAASAPPPFEWPPSTRLSYALTGSYRGPVEGQAQVEWLRSDNHYQVRLDVSVGPSFAPLLSRRISSDGELSEHGLSPRRYDEETKVAFRDPRRLTIVFDGDRIRLPGGRELPAPPGVQDTASQFVQLTWLFTTQPALLEPGRSIDVPLALPRYVDIWTYDVLAREPLATNFGLVETVHVKPRREPRPGIDLTAEMWVAPSLQYLPVRILIRQDAQTYVDLLATQLPLQAAPGR